MTRFAVCGVAVVLCALIIRSAPGILLLTVAVLCGAEAIEILAHALRLQFRRWRDPRAVALPDRGDPIPAGLGIVFSLALCTGSAAWGLTFLSR